MAVATIEDEAISPASNRRLQSLSRKMAVPNVEDEANSPPSNRHVQSLSKKMAVTSMSRRAISKKVINIAVCVSREVARKRNEQTINSEDANLNLENVDTHSSSPPAEASRIAKKIRRSHSATSEV
ncbi:unnamed protein product [Urochloa humidicola]